MSCKKPHSYNEALVITHRRLDIMTYEELLTRLMDNERLHPALETAIRAHAASMSVDVCNDYASLKNWVSRLGAAISDRWSSMEIAEQRELLVSVYPEMPVEHGPDEAVPAASIDSVKYCAGDTPRSLDAMSWPYLNQEDLTRPNALATFMDARAENLPFTFVRSKLGMGRWSNLRYQTSEAFAAFQRRDTRFMSEGEVYKGLWGPHFDELVPQLSVLFSKEPSTDTYGTITQDKIEPGANDTIEVSVLMGLQVL